MQRYPPLKDPPCFGFLPDLVLVRNPLTWVTQQFILAQAKMKLEIRWDTQQK